MAEDKKNIKSKSGELELIIITGLSGAGKSEALKYFEDAGGNNGVHMHEISFRKGRD